ncbi:MAG: hypothetical protein FWD17_04395 [Polyangiaceae bacterium]|nr:hypothetical protein [Polyangiaceae bacterium]
MGAGRFRVRPIEAALARGDGGNAAGVNGTEAAAGDGAPACADLSGRGDASVGPDPRARSTVMAAT